MFDLTGTWSIPKPMVVIPVVLVAILGFISSQQIADLNHTLNNACFFAMQTLHLRDQNGERVDLSKQNGAIGEIDPDKLSEVGKALEHPLYQSACMRRDVPRPEGVDD